MHSFWREPWRMRQGAHARAAAIQESLSLSLSFASSFGGIRLGLRVLARACGLVGMAAQQLHKQSVSVVAVPPTPASCPLRLPSTHFASQEQRGRHTTTLRRHFGHRQDHRGTATRPRPLHDGASGHREEPWPDLGGPGPWLPQPLPPPQRRTHHHAPPHPRPPTSPPSSHPPTEPPCKSSSRP